jgi:hypothetical protein
MDNIGEDMDEYCLECGGGLCNCNYINVDKSECLTEVMNRECSYGYNKSEITLLKEENNKLKDLIHKYERALNYVHDYQISLQKKLQLEKESETLPNPENKPNIYVTTLEEVLSYGQPKPEESPNMYVTWEKAHALLTKLKT